MLSADGTVGAGAIGDANGGKRQKCNDVKNKGQSVLRGAESMTVCRKEPSDELKGASDGVE